MPPPPQGGISGGARDELASPERRFASDRQRDRDELAHHGAASRGDLTEPRCDWPTGCRGDCSGFVSATQGTEDEN